MPVIETKGAASSQGFGEFSKTAVANWIEDCFSCFLYTGNGSTQTITNGVDLSTYGGLVWLKGRSGSFGTADHALTDTARGVSSVLATNQTYATSAFSAELTSFGANGFTLGNAGMDNVSGSNYASWTFRKQPKFFDVVTYTGNGGSPQVVNHSLGSTPGCVIIKRTDSSGDWYVSHNYDMGGKMLRLNSTAAAFAAGIGVTATTFSVFGASGTALNNVNGATYVAYLFAHNAGGFGLTGTDNVISCGSFTTDSGGAATVSLGYEPQFVIYKPSSAAGSWEMLDSMRGFCMTPSSGTTSRFLKANLANAETGDNTIQPQATGFYSQTGALSVNTTYIYIAIRRGPMKVPTSGTSVFMPLAVTPTSGTAFTVGFPFDAAIFGQRNGADSGNWTFEDRLRGFASNSSSSVAQLRSSSTGAELTTASASLAYYSPNNTGATYGPYYSGVLSIFEFFRRAPGFFDVVCYTGDGTFGMINHNLGVAPELVIYKSRSSTSGPANWWTTTNATTVFGGYPVLYLNSNSQYVGSGFSPWSSYFTNTQFIKSLDTSGTTYVAYLFASCPGVSKVGSYTGNGSTQTINCGFTSGARFVLIKRVDATGDWYVYDTARGMTTLTDPYLLLNSTAAESATLGSVTTVSTGFALNASILAAINTNGASYIFLAIA